MKNRTIYAVIADQLSSELTRMEVNFKLTDLDEEGILNFVKELAESVPAWNDVLDKKRIGMIFDAESGDKITCNRNSTKFFLEP